MLNADGSIDSCSAHSALNHDMHTQKIYQNKERGQAGSSAIPPRCTAVCCGALHLKFYVFNYRGEENFGSFVKLMAGGILSGVRMDGR